MQLTTDNYYSVEADRSYMSCSQYQDFLKCEAAAMAKLRGDYQPTETEALIVGNYVHTALESDEAHEAFCNSHFDDIYKYKVDKNTGEPLITGKYATYVQADKLINIFQTDPLISRLVLMEGENEKIMTGSIFGVPWKIRLDKYQESTRTIIDWKTTKDIVSMEWNPRTGQKETFIEVKDYMMRAAVYSEIEKQHTCAEDDPKFIIAAVSKQDPPDRGAFLLNDRSRYDWELDEVKKNLVRIIQVKDGRVKPIRCNNCAWCRATKRITKIVPYYTLNPAFREEPEEEYDEFLIHPADMADTQETAV